MGTDTGQRIATLTTEAENGRVLFSPDGTMFGIVGWHGFAVWDIRTGKALSLDQGCCDPDDRTLAFTTDSSYLAIGDANGSLELWDVETGEG